MTSTSTPIRNDAWKARFENRVTGKYPAFADRLDLGIGQMWYLRSLFLTIFDHPFHELIGTRMVESRLPITELYDRHGAVAHATGLLTDSERASYDAVIADYGVNDDNVSILALIDTAKLMTMVAIIRGAEAVIPEVANSARFFQEQLDSLGTEYGPSEAGACAALSLWYYIESGAELAMPWWLNLNRPAEEAFSWAVSSR